MARSDDSNGQDRRHPARQAPARVGRYLVLGTLARGGMGEVLRARAIGAAGAIKEVCIKRIRASRLGDRHAIERFVHEARLSLALTHANIVATFDFGRAEHDYYLAMEWIDGADLGRILDRARDAPVSIGLVAHVGAEVARALRHAHDADRADGAEAIVHCDVKPSNVLVSRSGDVKLADFGVAVARHEDHRGGTPRYTAPEMQEGGAVSAAVDLFALGVVLSDLAARATPSEPGTPLAEIASALDALIVRLEAATPEARPTASEALARLEELVARARVAADLSPRDELGRRAAEAAPTLDRADGSAELDPEASYLRDGQSELETRLTATTPSASIPRERAERRTPTPGLVVGAVALATIVALASLASWSRSAEPLLPPHTTTSTTATTAEAAADETPREAATGEERVGTTGAVEPTAEEPARVEPARVEPARVEPATLAPEVGTVASATVVEPALTTAHGRGQHARTRPGPTTGEASTTEASTGAAPTGEPTGRPEGPGSRGEEPTAEEPTAEEPEATGPAVLRINATPWANVEIDGRPVGPTPLVHVEVSPGPHTIVLTNPVLPRSRTTHLEVRAGEIRDVIVAM